MCWQTVPKSWSGSCEGVTKMLVGTDNCTLKVITQTIELTATTSGGYSLAVICEILWSHVV